MPLMRPCDINRYYVQRSLDDLLSATITIGRREYRITQASERVCCVGVDGKRRYERMVRLCNVRRAHEVICVPLAELATVGMR
jgi:hypothetical protein